MIVVLKKPNFCFVSIENCLFEKKLKSALRSSYQRCSKRKDVLKNFTKFTGKHLCLRLFSNKVAGISLELY